MLTDGTRPDAFAELPEATSTSNAYEKKGNLMPDLVNVKLSFQIPGIGSISGTWAPDKNERMAAWELYVELITRITVAELNPDEGLLREALSSLHSVFNTTREILRKYGPSVAQPKGRSDYSFGYMAVAMLNGILRPVLSKWHPELLAYEITREKSTPLRDHEAAWEHAQELRQVLNEMRQQLIEYANLFAEVAEVPSFLE